MEEEFQVNTVTGEKRNLSLMRKVLEIRAKKAEDRTLAEKLILKAHRIISMKYTQEGDAEPIEFEMFIPTSGEYDYYNKLSYELSQKDISVEEAKETSEKMVKFISDLFVDESITPEVLKSGEFPPDFQIFISANLNAAINEDREKAKEAKSFLRK